MNKETFFKDFKPVCSARVPDIVKHEYYCHHVDGLGPDADCCMSNCPFVKAIFKPEQDIDIHKIIDDAMEKKDRTVMIFINDSGVNVSVNPIEDKKPRWIRKTKPVGGFVSTYYVCSECGVDSHFPSSYCPDCGEKLAAPSEEDEQR